MEIAYAGLAGLYGGAIAGLLGWYFGRKKAKKEHGLDEMRDHVMKTARSFSWFATLGSIYILFTLLAIGIEIRTAAVLGIIMMVQMSSWGISAGLLNYHLSVGKTINVNGIIGFGIIIVSAVFFLILAILSNNWFLLFCPIPLGIIGVYFIKQGASTNEGEV